MKDILVLKGIDYSSYLMNPAEAVQSPEKIEADKQAAAEAAQMKELALKREQAEVKKLDAEGMAIVADGLRNDKKLIIETQKAEAEIAIEMSQQRPVDIG